MMNLQQLKISMIGAGNLATRLACALHESGCSVIQVFSRTMRSAELLAKQVEAQPICNTEEVDDRADVLIFALADKVLPDIIPLVAARNPKALMAHTAGSMPMRVFSPHAKRYGVFYPLQTFSKYREVDFKPIPFFIEASDGEGLSLLKTLAGLLSEKVYEADSEQRKRLHLAAVFANNFANHCYALSQQLLQQYDLPFEVLLPLIDETAAKVHDMAPLKAQTGPAIRFDENVIRAQEKLLEGSPISQQVYRLMSESIHRLAVENTAVPSNPNPDEKLHDNGSMSTSTNSDK